MAKSQFNSTLNVLTAQHAFMLDGKALPAGTDVIEVEGPLGIGAPEDYEHPIYVQFLIVQVPEDDETAASGETDETDTTAARSDVVRERGVGKEVLDVAGNPIQEPRWRGAIPLGDLIAGREEEIKRETRGVAVALLERREQFAFDTITWCDHIELVAK